MNKNKKYLFLFLCFFILLLLTQKRKLKGGLNICSPNNILNKNTNDNIIDLISSKVQIPKDQLKTHSYENLSTRIKTKIAEKSDITKTAIADKEGEIEYARNNAGPYSFTKDYIGGMYTLCETNSNVSLKKYDKLFTLLNTELLSQKELENKLAELTSFSNSQPQGLNLKTFQEQIQYYLTPKDDDGKMTIYTRGSILGRGKNDDTTVADDIDKYITAKNLTGVAATDENDDLNVQKTSGALNFLFFDWKAVITLTTEQKMKILAASYDYLFQKLPIVALLKNGTEIQNNIFFYKKAVYRGLEDFDTRDFFSNPHQTQTRTCVSFDLVEYETSETGFDGWNFANWLNADTGKYKEDIIQFYSDTDVQSQIEKIHKDLGFFFMTSSSNQFMYLFMSLGFNLTTSHKMYYNHTTNDDPAPPGGYGLGDTDVQNAEYIRIGNLVISKPSGQVPVLLNETAGLLIWTTKTGDDADLEIVINDTFQQPVATTSA